MTSNWKEYKLKNILAEKGYIRGPFGSALKRGELKNTGIPVYEQQHAIYNNRNFRFFIDEKKYEELHRFSTETNDLIISCSGTVGKVTIVKESDPKGIISQALLILRANTEIALPVYLKYFFESTEGYNSIISRSSGSVQINIAKREVIENIPIKLPDLKTQQKIAKVLSVIDDKIELNNSINNNLEQQAMALYDDLINRNKENLEEISLSDIANITMGQSPDGSSYNEDGVGTVFYQGRAEFGFRYPTRRLYTTEPKRMAYCNDVLMSVRAPVGDINVACEDCCIGRGLAAIKSKNKTPSFILYTMFNLKKDLNIFNGEGTIFGSINKDSLNSLKLNIPSQDEILKFEQTVSPLDKLIENNCSENIRLVQLRDTLLPKLMSGEIDVSNVDISTEKLSFNEEI